MKKDFFLPGSSLTGQDGVGVTKRRSAIKKRRQYISGNISGCICDTLFVTMNVQCIVVDVYIFLKYNLFTDKNKGQYFTEKIENDILSVI